MRVILTSNVPKLGHVGDVCTVKAGYGRNYLLPQGMAVLATPGAMKQVDDLKRTESKRQDKVRGEMTALAARMGRERLTFTAKVGETGRLYGSITASDIAEALSARIGEDVDRRKIILDESIRTLGEHVVPIHLMPGVDAHVTVSVEAEEGSPEILTEPELEAMAEANVVEADEGDEADEADEAVEAEAADAGADED
jgi:large subunit ribosomal protein L9